MNEEAKSLFLRLLDLLDEPTDGDFDQQEVSWATGVNDTLNTLRGYLERGIDDKYLTLLEEIKRGD